MTKMFYGASSNIFEKAKVLRGNMTEAETVLWEKLSNKKLDGHRFRRQHSISSFIADFYCHKAKLVIEVDGEVHQHEEQADYDEGRNYDIESLGIKVVRFSNREVIYDIDEVLRKIKKYLYTQFKEK